MNLVQQLRRGLQKLKLELPHDPAVPLWMCIRQSQRQHGNRGNLHAYINLRTIYNSQVMGPFWYLSADEQLWKCSTHSVHAHTHTHMTRQKDCQRQSIRNFSVLLEFLVISEVTTIKSNQCDCPNINWTTKRTMKTSTNLPNQTGRKKAYKASTLHKNLQATE